MVDVYVKDKYDLGLKEWFEEENPHVLAQTIERMLEAARSGYWQPEAGTVELLKTRYQELATRFDVRSKNARFLEYVADGQAVDADFAAPPEASSQALPESPELQGKPLEQVEGMQLESVQDAASDALADSTFDLVRLTLMALLMAVLAAGAVGQLRRPSGPSPSYLS